MKNTITFIILPLLCIGAVASAQTTQGGGSVGVGYASPGTVTVSPTVIYPTPQPINDDSGFVQFNNLIVESVSSGTIPGEIVATVNGPIPMMNVEGTSGVLPMRAGSAVQSSVSAANPSVSSVTAVTNNCYKFSDQLSTKSTLIPCPTPPQRTTESTTATTQTSRAVAPTTATGVSAPSIAVPASDVRKVPAMYPYRMSYRIEISAGTQLLMRDRTRAQLSDFSAGDQINVFGYYNTDGTIEAYLVRDLSKPAERQTVQLNGVTLIAKSGATIPATLAVTQTAYNPCYQFDVRSTKMPIACPMGLQGFSGDAAIKMSAAAYPNYAMLRKYEVVVDANTVILDRNRKVLTLADLVEGDELNVYGETTNNAQSVTADIVRDMSLPAIPTTLSGTIVGVNTDGSFTMQTNDGRTVTVQNPAKTGASVSVQGMFDRTQHTMSQVTVIYYGNAVVSYPPTPVPLPMQPMMLKASATGGVGQ